MNIIEAVKSGKRFKRKHESAFYGNCAKNYLIPTDDLIAEDWEIEEKTVTITQAEFLEHWRQAFMETNGRWYANMVGLGPALCTALLHRLGLD